MTVRQYARLRDLRGRFADDSADQGVYGLVDIKMRMLCIPELKPIIDFPENYVLIGTQADQKKFIGNAAEVTMARVLCEATCT